MNLKEEKKLWEKGYQWIIGLDESGRGPIAGPVVAAAVMIKNHKLQAPNYKQISMTKIQNSKQKSFGHLKIGNWELFGIWTPTLPPPSQPSAGPHLEFGISRLRDSKKLSPKQREKLYKLIIKNPIIKWGIGKVSEKVIDKINILNATKLAMKRAIRNLSSKLKVQSSKFFLIIDGNFKLDLPVPQKSIVKGDEKVFSCALASILAKVWRDKIMLKYHKKYPTYGFDKHKGYPTKYHRKMLKKYGSSKIHRKTFKLF